MTAQFVPRLYSKYCDKCQFCFVQTEEMLMKQVESRERWDSVSHRGDIMFGQRLVWYLDWTRSWYILVHVHWWQKQHLWSCRQQRLDLVKGKLGNREVG